MTKGIKDQMILMSTLLQELPVVGYGIDVMAGKLNRQCCVGG